MTNSTFDAYTDALNDLAFSDEEKRRLVARLQGADAAHCAAAPGAAALDTAPHTGADAVATAEAETMTPAQEPARAAAPRSADILELPTAGAPHGAAASGSPSPVAARTGCTATQPQARATHTARPARPARRRNRVLRIAAAAAVVAALSLGGGSVAVASGVLPNPADVLSDLFGEAPAETELLGMVGHPLDASSTSNGITVTADAIIGDRHNLAVVFSIAREDGAPLDGVRTLDTGTTNLSPVPDFSVDGVRAAGGTSYTYDADPSDNAIQLVVQYQLDTADGNSIIGRTARFSLGELSTFTDEDGHTTIATGDWKLKFTVNYDDTTIDVPCTQPLTFQGAGVTVDELNVSAIGVNVRYRIARQYDLQGGTGKMTDADSAGMDAVIGLPILVTMDDGTVYDVTNAAASASDQPDGTIEVSKGWMFERIVDPAHIASVRLGDTVLPVSA